MKKVAIIGSAGVPAQYGGFETLADQLAQESSEDFQLHIYCSSTSVAKEDRVKEYEDAKLHYLPIPANGPLSTVYDAFSMIHAMFFAHSMLILGVSGCLFLPILRVLYGGRIIVNIDGVEWRREKWGPVAKKFLKFSEYMAIKFADTVITDNKALQDFIENEYGAKTTLVEYGGDHCQPIASTIVDRAKYKFMKEPYAVKVCRIEPENNIETVLEAFSISKLPLVLVGNWKVSEYAENLRDKYKIFENLHLLDPIYDRRAIDMIRSNALLYIHGHSAGGTNPSLVEAMSLGLPILAFDCSFNRETTENAARFFQTAKDLEFLVDSPRLWLDTASKMQEIAERRYTWLRITQMYEDLFEEEKFEVPVTNSKNKKEAVAA